MPRQARIRGKGNLVPQDVVTQVDIGALVDDVRYHGSEYHCAQKPQQWMPQKTKCPEDIDDAQALMLLRKGMKFGVFSANLDGRWPKQVWAVDDSGRVYEAQLTNREVGEYHGYPMASGDKFARIIAEKWRNCVDERA